MSDLAQAWRESRDVLRHELSERECLDLAAQVEIAAQLQRIADCVDILLDIAIEKSADPKAYGRG